MKSVKSLVILMALSLWSCSMGEGITPSDNKVNVGDRLPSFVVTMHDGTRLATDDLRGKPSVIIFFSTTCSDCQRELPMLDKRYREHGSDTTFVAISREQGDDVVTDYWQANGLSLPYSAQADRTVYSLFAKKGIPRVYIANANLTVTASLLLE